MVHTAAENEVGDGEGTTVLRTGLVDWCGGCESRGSEGEEERGVHVVCCCLVVV